MYFPIADWEQVASMRAESEYLHIGGLKAFSDGSLGSSTAAFREPYEGRPHDCGLLMQPMLDGSMARWIAEADARGLRLAIHAIGDDANDRVLTLLESRPDHRARRDRIEHAQHLDAGLVRRFAEARVVASMQPYHAIDDGRWAESRIGAARAPWAFPWRSLLDAGAIVTFGSDWPVAPLDPLTGIRAATTRAWIPEQRITFEEALRCYTTNNAWALFAEREIGAIAPGMLADLVVLSDDAVDMTIFDGRVIYER
jgi:predicted amidohydrolase YtcJ